VLPSAQIFPSAHRAVGAAVGGRLTGMVEGRMVGRFVAFLVGGEGLTVTKIVGLAGAADGICTVFGATAVTRSRSSGADSSCHVGVSDTALPKAPACGNDEFSPPRSCAPITRHAMAKMTTVDGNAIFMAEVSEAVITMHLFVL
jgi:hypothetical protein